MGDPLHFFWIRTAQPACRRGALRICSAECAFFAGSRNGSDPVTSDYATSIGCARVIEPDVAFAVYLEHHIKLLKVQDSEPKGKVQEMNLSFRNRAMRGQAFPSPDNFDRTLDGWLPSTQNGTDAG